MIAEMRPTRTLEQILSGTSWVVAGTICGVALEYFNKIVVARWFGPSGYGVLTLMLSLALLATNVSMLGFHSALAHFIPSFLTTGRAGLIRRLVISSRRIVLVAGLACAVAFLVSRDQISERLIKSHEASGLFPFPAGPSQ